MKDVFENKLWIHWAKRRYYRLVVQHNLFRELVVIRSWGALDSNAGNMITMYMDDIEQVHALIMSTTRTRLRRGYVEIIHA